MSNIIELKKTKLPKARDAFYQAIPVSEIQGQFFNFARNKKQSPAMEIDTERAKLKALYKNLPTERCFEILYNPVFAKPGPLAYRLWTGLEKLVSDMGSDFDGTVKLSMRQMATISRRSYSGKTAEELNDAIDQLENHKIHYWYPDTSMPNDDGSLGMKEAKFTFIEQVTRVREDRKSTPYYYVLKVPDIILGFIFHDRYFFCMSWDRIDALSPHAHSMARILYRYMSYRYSKEQSKNFVYKKDYATICKNWLGGLTPHSELNAVKRKHLAPRLDPIVASGLLASYEVAANANKTGFNVQFVPGEAFFQDFGSFYNKQLPLDFSSYSKEDNNSDSHPKSIDDNSFELLAHFHNSWFGVERAHQDYVTAEIKLAQIIMSEEANLTDAKGFVNWAILKARETNFKMRTFAAIKQYRATWKDERRREQKRLENFAEETAHRAEQIRLQRYEIFVQNSYEECRSTLTSVELDIIASKAQTQLEMEFPETRKFFKPHRRGVENSFLKEYLELPDYETWCETEDGE